MLRRSAAALTAFALLLVLAVPAMAGGWAQVVADTTATTEPPIDDQPVEIGFTVLQHGETPAGWVTPTVHVTYLATGTTIDVPASGRGPDGHFVATFTPINPGFVGWTVSMPELVAESPTITLAVHHADGTAPVFDPAMAMTAIQGMPTIVRDEILSGIQPDLDRLTSQASLQQATIDRLSGQVEAITAERDALAASLGEAGGAGEATSGTLAALVLLAVLAGGAAGFLMAWLGHRSGPRQTETALTAAPRGSSPG